MQKVEGSSPFIRLGFPRLCATYVPQTMTLDWQPRRLRINWRTQHTVEARVASAPDGGWYLAWKATDGWSIGRTGDLTEPVTVSPLHWSFPERRDVELIGLAWAMGLSEAQVKRHLGFDLSDEEPRTGAFRGSVEPVTSVV
jgi:hypothetical protein